MRIPSRLSVVALGAATAAIVSGCSGGGSSAVAPNSALPLSPASATRSAQSVLTHGSIHSSGVAPRFAQMRPHGTRAPITDISDAAKFTNLDVTDDGTVSVDIFNSSYAIASTITSGLAGPDGDWVDASGNLYVADYDNAAVYEYAPGAKTPKTTYTAGLEDPINVTTDSKGNVYAAEYNDDQGNGVIFEYAQGSNTIKHQCSPPGASIEGIAVKADGAVFVSYNNASTGEANILEYKSGLSGCNATVLGVTLGFAGGLAIKSNGTLLAVDQYAGVDTIPYPYTTVKSTITGASDPFHIALDSAEDRIYIVDAFSDVLVDYYPSGTNVKVLGSSSGLSEPLGVATYPN